MAVISVVELPQSQFSRDAEGQRDDVRVFHVQTDSRTDNEYQIAFAAGLPAQGEINPRNPLTFAARRTVTRSETIFTLFTVTVEYSSRYNPEEDEEGDPLAMLPTVSWDSFVEERVLERDAATGAPIRMTSGERPETPLMKPTRVVVLRLTRNESNFNIATALAYIDTVNSAQFTVLGFTIPTYQCLIANISTPGREYGYSTPYYPITYELHFRQGELDPNESPETEYCGWDELILNQGYEEAWESTITGDILSRPIIDTTTGTTLTTPCLLDANGARLPIDGDPVYLRFAKYKRTNHADLALPEVAL